MAIEKPKPAALFKECAALTDPALSVLNANHTSVSGGWIRNDQKVVCRHVWCGCAVRTGYAAEYSQHTDRIAARMRPSRETRGIKFKHIPSLLFRQQSD